MSNIGVYWDFENIHASLCARERGSLWYRDNLFVKQPHLVDVNTVMQYVAELGNVNINRAYANWSFLHAYSFDLQNHAIDLIQLFPRGRFGKNGADIRMSIEIIEDLYANPHIDTVVVVGGDSDYISVAQKVRQRGKAIIGIGVQETTNPFWVKSCNEFKYYSSLLIKSSKIESLEAEGYELDDIDAAKSLVRRAVEAGASGTGRDYVLKAALKPLLQRFDPSFDESNFGFKSFSDFLAECSDVIEVSVGEYDHMVKLKDGKKSRVNGSVSADAGGGKYDAILRKQQVRLVGARLLDLAVAEAFAMLHGKAINTIDFRKELARRMLMKVPGFTDTDATKIRALLYKAAVFRYLDNNQTTLVPEVGSPDDLAHRIRLMIFTRIADSVADDEIDAAGLSELLYGDRHHISAVKSLIAEYKKTA